MKKSLRILLLALVLCLALLPMAAAAQSGGAVLRDDADLLSANEEAALLKQMEAVTQKHGAAIIIVTVTSFDGSSSKSFANNLYDTNHYGIGANRDGVMLVLSIEDREFWILSNGFAGNAISNSKISTITDAITPYLSDGMYNAAFQTFTDESEYYLNGYLNGFPFPLGKNLLISLVVGFVIGLITVLIMKGQLKSVRMQNQANNYVKQGSMHLTASHDLYLYRHVSRVRRQNSSSGSGSRGGGSRSGGGGRF